MSGGTLSAGTAATYTGDTSVSNGRVSIRVDNALSSGTLTLGSGAVLGTDSNRRTLANSVVITGDVQLSETGSRLTLSGPIDLGHATRTITAVNSAHNGNLATDLSGVISGNAGIVKQGTGILDLSNGGNTCTGNLSLDEGTLRLRSNAMGNAANKLISGGGGSVGLSNVGTQAVSLSNAVDVHANFQLNAGGGVTLGGAMNLGGATRTVTLTGAQTKALNDVISNGGLALVVDAGTVNLGGANTYAGQTVVSASTLALGAGGSIANSAGAFLSSATSGLGTITGNLTLGTGAGLILSSQALIGGQPLTVTGAASLPNAFGVASLFGTTGQPFDFGLIPDGTYTLINNASTFSNILNFGPTNAASVGGGRSAYFAEGSLNLVVVPEPSVLFLGLGVGTLAALRLRRRGA